MRPRACALCYDRVSRDFRKLRPVEGPGGISHDTNDLNGIHDIDNFFPGRGPGFRRVDCSSGPQLVGLYL